MEDMLNIEELSEEEKMTILRVIKRDEELRKTQDTRVSQLKTELHNLRMQSILREGDDLSKICARCHKPFGFFFNTGDICSQCKFRVCSVCRESLLSGKWLCILCYKQVQLKGLTGEWIYGETDNEGHRRMHSGADMVKASLRKSLSNGKVADDYCDPAIESYQRQKDYGTEFGKGREFVEQPSDVYAKPSPHFTITGNVPPKTRDGDGSDGLPDSKRRLSKSNSASQDDLDRVGYPKDSDKKRLSSLFDSFRSSKDDLNDEQYQVKHVSCRRRRDSDSESDSGSSVEGGESPMEVVDSKPDNVLSASGITQSLSETESASEPLRDQTVSPEMTCDNQVPNDIKDAPSQVIKEGDKSEEPPRRSQSPATPPMTPTEAVFAAKKRFSETENIPVSREESSAVSPLSSIKNASQPLDHRPAIVRRTSSEKSDSSFSSARTASPATKMRLLDLASKRALEREGFDQEESGNDSPRPRNSLNSDDSRTRQHGPIFNGSSSGRHGYGAGCSAVEWRSHLVGGGMHTTDLIGAPCHLSHGQAPPSPQIMHSFMHDEPFHAVDTERREIIPTEHEHTGSVANNMHADSHTPASADVVSTSVSSQNLLHEESFLITTDSNINVTDSNLPHVGPGLSESECDDQDTLSTRRLTDHSYDTAAAMSASQDVIHASLIQGFVMGTNANIPTVTEFHTSPITDKVSSDVKVSITSPEPTNTQIVFNVSPHEHTKFRYMKGMKDSSPESQGKEGEDTLGSFKSGVTDSANTNDNQNTSKSVTCHEEQLTAMLSPLLTSSSSADAPSRGEESKRTLSQYCGSESMSPQPDDIDIDIGVSELLLGELNPKFAKLVQSRDGQPDSDSSIEEEGDVRCSSEERHELDDRVPISETEEEILGLEEQLIDLTVGNNTSQTYLQSDNQTSLDPFNIPDDLIATPFLGGAISPMEGAEKHKDISDQTENQLIDLSETSVASQSSDLISFTTDPVVPVTQEQDDVGAVIDNQATIIVSTNVREEADTNYEKDCVNVVSKESVHHTSSKLVKDSRQTDLHEPVSDKDCNKLVLVHDGGSSVPCIISTDTSQTVLTDYDTKHSTDTSDSDVTISDLTNSSKFSDGSDPSISSLSSDTTSSVLAVNNMPSLPACHALPSSENIKTTDNKQAVDSESVIHVQLDKTVTHGCVSSVKQKGVGNQHSESSAPTVRVVLAASDLVCQDAASASANSPQPETCSESEVDDIEVAEFPMYVSPNETEDINPPTDQITYEKQMEAKETKRNGVGTLDDIVLVQQNKVKSKDIVLENEDVLETKSEPSSGYQHMMVDSVPERTSTPKHQTEVVNDEELFRLVSMSRSPAANTTSPPESPRRRSKDDSELVLTKPSPSTAQTVNTTAASSAATVINLSTIGLASENDEGDPFASESVSVNVREAMQRYLEQEDELSDCLSVITERTEPDDDSDDVSEISRGLDETVEDEDLDKEIEKIYQANLNIDTYLSSDKFSSGSAAAAVRKARRGQQKKHIEEVLSSPILNELADVSEVEGDDSKDNPQTEKADKVSISDTISAYLSEMSSVDNSNRQTPTSSEHGTDEESDPKSDNVVSEPLSEEQDSAWFDMSLSMDSVKEVLTSRQSGPIDKNTEITASNETLCDEELPQDETEKTEEPDEQRTPVYELLTQDNTSGEPVSSSQEMKDNQSEPDRYVISGDHVSGKDYSNTQQQLETENNNAKQTDIDTSYISDDPKSDVRDNNDLKEVWNDNGTTSTSPLPVHDTDVCSTSDTNIPSPHTTSLPNLEIHDLTVTLTSPSAASPASQFTNPTESPSDMSPQVKVTSEALSDETESHGGDSGHISGTSAENTPEHKSRSPRLSHLSIPSLAMTSTSAEEASQQDEEDEDIDKVVASHKSFGSLRGSYGNLHSSLADSRESLYSVYSDAGEINYGKIPVTGEILFGLDYNYKTGALEIYVKQCKEIAPVDTKRNKSDPYVKTYLLPDRTRSGKRKTKIKKHTLNPTFDEVLRYVISKSEVENRVLWVTVWHHDRFGRNDFLGEVMIALDCYKFGDATPIWYPLQERLEAPSSAPVSYKGDLVVSLKYVTPENIDAKDVSKKGKSKKTKGSPEKGELQVLVKEARNLTAVRSNGSSDPFCKAYLLPEKHKSSKQKTPVVKRNCNPTWNHVFLFEDVSIEEMKDRSLELTIWDYDKITSNDFLGGIRLNLGTGVSVGRSAEWMDARGEEIAIWQSMLDRPNCWNDATIGLRASMGKSEIRK